MRNDPITDDVFDAQMLRLIAVHGNVDDAFMDEMRRAVDGFRATHLVAAVDRVNASHKWRSFPKPADIVGAMRTVAEAEAEAAMRAELERRHDAELAAQRELLARRTREERAHAADVARRAVERLIALGDRAPPAIASDQKTFEAMRASSPNPHLHATQNRPRRNRMRR